MKIKTFITIVCIAGILIAISNSNKDENSKENPSSEITISRENNTYIQKNESAAFSSAEKFSAEASQNSNIRTDFKQALDNCEIYYTKYCNLVKKMTKSPDNIEYLEEYVDITSQYDKVMKDFNSWSEEDLSEEELGYFYEVSGRITEMLLEIQEMID